MMSVRQRRRMGDFKVTYMERHFKRMSNIGYCVHPEKIKVMWMGTIGECSVRVPGGMGS